MVSNLETFLAALGVGLHLFHMILDVGTLWGTHGILFSI
jgi:hypothetical protein